MASTVRTGSSLAASPRRCIRGRSGHHGYGSVRRSRAARPEPLRASGRNGIPLDEGSCSRGRRCEWPRLENLTIEAEDERPLGLAQPDRVLGQRLEDRLEIEGGPPDHLEQLAGRRLLLQRHPQLAVPFLQLLEQAHVRDSDDGLVGEGLKQRDLLVRERITSSRRRLMVPTAAPSRSSGTPKTSGNRTRVRRRCPRETLRLGWKSAT